VHLLKKFVQPEVYQTPGGGASLHHVTYPLSYQAPLQIPDPLKKWPESSGIGGRFEPEWVSGLKRNHCPLSTGIYKVGEDRIITRLPNKSEAMTAKTSHMMKDEER
jgi:hypothetical protein